MKKRNGIRALALAGLLICLTGCGAAAEPTQPPTEDPALLVTEFALVANDGAELAQLDQYPNLAEVDLRGSICHDAVLAYVEDHPEIRVRYEVPIGDTLYKEDTAELALEEGFYDYDQLMENLAFLPDLASMSLPRTGLTGEELAELQAAYPDIAVDYTVMVLDQEVSGATEELDLSWLQPEQVSDAVGALSRLGSLRDVQLMNGEGKSALAMTDVKTLMQALPEATVHYTFELFGKTISTTDERVEYVGTKIHNSGVEQVRQALDILPNCTYFLMDSCNVTNDVMAQLRDDYPDTKIVWRVRYSKDYSDLTDTEVIRCVGQLDDSNSVNLKYFTDVVYLDIGHSYTLSDLSFISCMPKLKVAIVVDCYANTLEHFANCKELQYLEIVNCNRMTDLSPLANCTQLRGLNMSYTFSINDLSPLYGLEHMERLFLGRNDFTEEEVAEAREALPNCWVTDKSESVAWVGFNYSVGWRLDDEHTFAQWYKEIKEIFGYTREIY